MKAKIKKAICIALVGVMVAHGTYAKPIEAKAMGTVAISAGMTLFLVLASMGIVASHIYHVQHLNDEWDEAVQAYKDSMNAYKPGLYDDVMESRAKSNGQTLKIEADTWADVRGWVSTRPTINANITDGIINNKADLERYVQEQFLFYPSQITEFRRSQIYLDDSITHYYVYEKAQSGYNNNRERLLIGTRNSGLNLAMYRRRDKGSINYSAWSIFGNLEDLKNVIERYDLTTGSSSTYEPTRVIANMPVVAFSYQPTSASISTSFSQVEDSGYYIKSSSVGGITTMVNDNRITRAISIPTTTVYDREISEGVYDVLTPGRVLTEEKDDTDKRVLVGDYTITIPKAKALSDVMDGVEDGTKDIADILPLINVIPVDLATDTTITDSRPITEAITDIPDLPLASDYIVRLEEFFPFCIPFDIYNIFRLFNAEPEAPAVRWKFPNVDRSGTISYVEYDIDLSQFDTVAQWLRRFELIAFVVGLLAATRHIMKE